MIQILNFYINEHKLDNGIWDINLNISIFFILFLISVIIVNHFSDDIELKFVEYRVRRKNNFLELMLFEFYVGINAILINLKNSKNLDEFNKSKNDLHIFSKKYGFYISKQYKSNKLSTNELFNILCWPIAVTLICEMILNISNSDGYQAIIILVMIFVFLVFLFNLFYNNQVIDVNGFIFNIDEMIDGFLKNYQNNEEICQFNIDYLTESDLDLLKNNLKNYFKAIKHIKKQESKLYKLNRAMVIDIFNFEESVLINKYKLSSLEISSYLNIKMLREKHFENNKLM